MGVEARADRRDLCHSVFHVWLFHRLAKSCRAGVLRRYRRRQFPDPHGSRAEEQALADSFPAHARVVLGRARLARNSDDEGTKAGNGSYGRGVVRRIDDGPTLSAQPVYARACTNGAFRRDRVLQFHLWIVPHLAADGESHAREASYRTTRRLNPILWIQPR